MFHVGPDGLIYKHVADKVRGCHFAQQDFNKHKHPFSDNARRRQGGGSPEECDFAQACAVPGIDGGNQSHRGTTVLGMLSGSLNVE